MSFALGTATGRIILDYDGTGVDAAKKDVEGLKKSSMSASDGFGKIGKTAGIAGALIVGGLAVAVNTAADFESRMSAVSAVSGATGGELDRLRDKALQLGKDTAFSASESASAIEELVKAGLSVDDVMSGAADATVALAAAGEIALPEAAAIASNAMNQFSLAADQLPKVADLIAGAANASAIDVGDLGMSLSQVGAVANLAGVSFEDTATAIALMGNAGIKGSDAGTSLKSMFMRLQPTTKKQYDLMNSLGLITDQGTSKFYDQEGQLKSLGDVSQMLQGSLKGMTKEQQQATLQTLFGSDAIRAATVLAKNGADGFDEMSDSMGKVSAADVAKTRMDNLKGSLEEMEGSLETVGIQLGTILIPYLRKLVDAISRAADWFLNLDDSTQKIIVTAIAVAGALLLIISGIIAVVSFVSAMSAAFAAVGAVVGGAMGAVLSPVLAVVAVIALVGAALYLLWQKNARFRDMVMAAWGQIKAGIAAFVSFFTGTVWPEIKSIVDLIIQSWNELKTSTSGAMTLIRNIFSIALNLMLSQWQTVWNLIVGVTRGVWTAIKGVITGALMIIKGIINTVMGVLKGDWGQAWNGIKQILRGSLTIMSGMIRGAMQVAKSIIVATWNTVKNFTSAAWRATTAVIRSALAAARGAVASAVGAILGALSSAWNSAKSKTQSAFASIVSAVKGKIGEVVGALKSLAGDILGALAGLPGQMFTKGVEIVQGLINGIKSMAGDLAGAAKSVIGDGIGKLIPGSPVKEGPLRVLNQGYAGKKIVQMIIEGIDYMAPNLYGAMAAATGGAAPIDYGANGATLRRGVVASKSRGNNVMNMRGVLSIDADGIAFIRGVAEDVVDEANDDNNRRRQM